MSSISIDKLRPHPSNNLYFDDLTGEDWEAFLNDIRENGIRDPLRITPDFQIICGHQRFRAAKELGFQTVPVIIEDIQNVEDIERLLVEDNLHRRHLTPIQKAKLASTLKERWGVRRGGAKGQNVRSLSDIAAVIGESEKTTQRLIKLNDLIPEFKRLVESKKLGTTFAEKLASFTPEEQMSLYKTFGDEIGKAAKAEAEQYIREAIEFEKKKLEKKYRDAVPRDAIPDIEAAAIERHREETEILIQQRENELKQKFKRELEDLRFQLKQYQSGYKEATEKLKSLELRKADNFDEEQARLQREKMQHEADMNTIQLRIVYKQFIEKAAISPYLAGAIATANPGERQRFKELVEMAEGIIRQTKIALTGRKVVEENV